MVLLTIADGEVQSIIDAESVTGVEIDEFSKKDYVRADGTEYSYGKTATLADSLGTATSWTTTTTTTWTTRPSTSIWTPTAT